MLPRFWRFWAVFFDGGVSERGKLKLRTIKRSKESSKDLLFSTFGGVEEVREDNAFAGDFLAPQQLLLKKLLESEEVSCESVAEKTL